MRARWIGVVVLCLVALLLSWLARSASAAEWEEGFGQQRVDRIARLDFELAQVQQEQQRLVDERRDLIRERACVARAPSRETMRRCAATARR